MAITSDLSELSIVTSQPIVPERRPSQACLLNKQNAEANFLFYQSSLKNASIFKTSTAKTKKGSVNFLTCEACSKKVTGARAMNSCKCYLTPVTFRDNAANI